MDSGKYPHSWKNIHGGRNTKRDDIIHVTFEDDVTASVYVPSGFYVHTNPYEFHIGPNPQFLHLAKNYLFIELKIVKEDSTNLIHPPAAQNVDPLVGPINLIGKTLIRQVKLSLNGSEVTNMPIVHSWKQSSTTAKMPETVIYKQRCVFKTHHAPKLMPITILASKHELPSLKTVPGFKSWRPFIAISSPKQNTFSITSICE